jgi:hypothetical protein
VIEIVQLVFGDCFFVGSLWCSVPREWLGTIFFLELNQRFKLVGCEISSSSHLSFSKVIGCCTSLFCSVKDLLMKDVDLVTCSDLSYSIP